MLSSQTPTHRWLEFLLVSVVFLLCFFAVRRPLFKLGWDGADGNGHDADIVVHQPAKPNYMLSARFDGRNVYLPATGHPAPMYSMLSQLGRALGHFVTFEKMTDADIVRLLKRVISCGQLFIWWPLLVLACFSRGLQQKPLNRFLAYAALLALACSPMALNGSNEFQMDSFFGFVMAGWVVLALAGRDRFPRAGSWLIFLAAAFLGLGKNEWNAVLLAAVVAMLLYAFIPRLVPDAVWRRRAWACAGWATLGLLAGNLVSLLFEPHHYLSGWKLLHYMMSNATVAKPAGAGQFTRLTLERLPFIHVQLLLLAYLAWRFLAARPLPSPFALLGGAFGAGLFFAFFFSTWGNFPRYFAPAFSALAATALWTYSTWSGNVTRVTALLVVCVCAWCGCRGHAFTHDPEFCARCQSGVRPIQFGARLDGVPLLNVEDVYRRPDVDFLHATIGPKEGREILRDYGSRPRPVTP